MIDPCDASLPLPVRWVAAHGITWLTPWSLIDEASTRAGLRRQFQLEVSGGSREITDCLPFARRQDCDDVAAFVVSDGVFTHEVIVAHLTWRDGPERDGFPGMERFPTFWDWFARAIRDSSEWASEEALPDVIAERDGRN